MTKRKTHSQFLDELKIINPQIIPEEEYQGSSIPIMCFCSACKHRWKVRPNALLRGYGCPKCAGNLRKSNESFLTELLAVNPDIEPLEKYNGNKNAILCKCKNCGHEWKVLPNNLLSKGHKCPKCSHIKRGEMRRKSNEDFVSELLMKNPNILPLESYTTSQKKIQCKCLVCGNIWLATPNNLLDKGSRCPSCSHAATSTIEQILIGSFSTALGEDSVLSRDKKTIGKELDVYIPEKKLAVEFGAWFWHRKKLSGDNEKQKLCKEKGIHLITILEDCPEAISASLFGDYRIYQAELSNESDYHTIREILKEICIENDIPYSQIECNWDSIIEIAHLKSQRLNHNDFELKLHRVNSKVSLMERYTKSNVKLLCKCNVCGHKWKALPTTLLQGIGCPSCARKITGQKKTISNEEFLYRLSKINNDIEPLDTYEKDDIEIRCKCLKCGNIWYVKPKNLLVGHGCPKCGRIASARKQSKPIRCVETGMCYESLAELIRKTHIYGANKCAKGYQETAGGYHWEYVDN